MPDRIKLPSYTRSEEIMNMATHIVGGAFGIVSLIICLITSGLHQNIPGIVSSVLYGISMITVYTVSSVYHGLSPEKSEKGKKVMRIIDHCDINFLIVGTYAPIALTGLLKIKAPIAIVSFAIVCLTAVVGIIFTAVNFERFKKLSYAVYFIAGWSVLATTKYMIKAFSPSFFILIVAGGIAYTLGTVFYVMQKKGYKYCHGVFHIFIVLGSVIQFIPIIRFCM